MKNPYEVLLAKEAELARIKQEVRSLHIAIHLLRDDGDSNPSKEPSKPCSVVSRIADDPNLKESPQPNAHAGVLGRRVVFFKAFEHNSC
jgi:hypothetical protein